MRDDLGAPFARSGPARRIVSLVPSLTESVAGTDPAALVGATDWCTHPADLAVPRVRGTKNPDLRAVLALAPDVVLANQEENRRRDVERLRAAGLAVWVTRIETLDQAFDSLRRMFAEALGWRVPDWLGAAERVWAGPAPDRGAVVVPVWRDPWMVVGRSTFTGDLLHRLGYRNVFADHPDRYPRLPLADLLSQSPDVVLLPDEPYPFAADDGPEAFAELPTVLVSGRDLTWYGPSLLGARERLSELPPGRGRI
ncbi:helical backbone metal receptor [Skermania piniformis]|uniref:Helical backbone metal receptor n=1 Tax=Skermania pinensis TaxID=39122 RepID=A0ABX8S7V0_9ACTN|nr:helical backbone metal receptor [Skermania piniformis]QXQ13938.1 helical backbone metal receptor [Skermania piniformis]